MIDHTFAIPVYQTSKYLEECIKHLKAQTINSQIILTTSTPTAETRQIADRYRLPYFINFQREAGIAADWNFALNAACTQLVTIAHQDDIYAPGYAESLIKHFEQNISAEPVIAFTNYQDLVHHKIRKPGLNAAIKQLLLFPFLFTSCISNPLFKKLILRFGDPICCPSITFNKNTLSDFTFSESFECALDWLAWYQLAERKGAFIYVNKKLLQHRIHPGSETTRQLQNGRRKQEEHQLFEMMWGKRIAGWLARWYAIGHRNNL